LGSPSLFPEASQRRDLFSKTGGAGKLILSLDSFRDDRITIFIDFIIFARRIPLFILESFGG
jgi:hypothetical protein